MNNPILGKLLEVGKMEYGIDEIYPSFELSELIRKGMAENGMKAEFHFDKNDGKLVFEKVLGRDENGDFFSDANGNLEQRKEEIKKVIVLVLLNEYKKEMGDI